MRRTGFKPKPRKSMKRGKLHKASKQPISKIQRTLWQLCKQIVRKHFKNSCYTCGKTGLVGVNWQSGHMWPKAAVGASLKYDIRILRPQCFHCNINLGGNGAEFYARMLREIGEEEMAKLQRDRQVSVKAYDHYLALIEKYTNLLNEKPSL